MRIFKWNNALKKSIAKVYTNNNHQLHNHGNKLPNHSTGFDRRGSRANPSYPEKQERPEGI